MNNIESVKLQQKNRDYRRRNQNPSKEQARQQKYYLENKINLSEKHKLYHKEKRQTDILFKIADNLRSRIRGFINCGKVSKNNKTFQLIGCSPNVVKVYLESKFDEKMDWSNYGLHGWHIDHIVPLSSAKTEEDLYKLCHYTNLQPLWAKDNWSKSNKLDYL